MHSRMRMKKGNLFTQIPASLAQELFEPLLEHEAIRIERIVSRGQSSPERGWYDQAQDEWVAVLRGGATLGFEDGSSIDLAPGDYLVIPAHCKHRVISTSSSSETIWLAVHY